MNLIAFDPLIFIPLVVSRRWHFMHSEIIQHCRIETCLVLIDNDVNFSGWLFPNRAHCDYHEFLADEKGVSVVRHGYSPRGGACGCLRCWLSCAGREFYPDTAGPGLASREAQERLQGQEWSGDWLPIQVFPRPLQFYWRVYPLQKSQLCLSKPTMFGSKGHYIFIWWLFHLSLL